MEKVFEFVRATLTLFKAVPNVSDKNFLPHAVDNEKNLARGFFVTERAAEACPIVADENIRRHIKEKFGYDVFELNQGFYKSFRTVADSTPQKILANKLLHYMTTYGFENLGIFDRELVYIPNDALDLPADAKPTKITVIDAIDDAEIERRTKKFIFSGVALSNETIDALSVVVNFLGIEIDVDAVPNKEFAVRLCDMLKILPADPVQFLRYEIYRATGSTLLIKDSETIEAIKTSGVNFSDDFAKYIAKNGRNRLSEQYFRFKPLWLAFKKNSDYLRGVVNKLRKLADKNHRPLPQKFLEHLTSAAEIDCEELQRELANVTPFKKISLANAIRYRLSAPESIVYSIRNGKAYADDFRGGLKFDGQKIFDAIVDSIAEDVKPNVAGKKIFAPKNFEYAAPVSEKNFVGNIPAGSSYAFAKNSVVVGVHWFNLAENNSEVRIDLDLHLNSQTVDIGWQNDFGNENFINARERKIIFSGDMTDAPISAGGATEAFFVGEMLTDDFLTVNLNHYNHFADSAPVPFKIILADVAQDKIDRQYLLDAHEIAFCVPAEISSGEMFLGFLASNELGEKKFYFFARNMGNRITAHSDGLTDRVNSAMASTFESRLTLNEILTRAGAIVDDVTADDCDINLDPAEVTKDILLDLFAK